MSFMKTLYENTARRYDKRHENPTTQYLREKERKALKSAKGLVLDVGCGTGEHAVFDGYIGCDISRNMIKEATKKKRKAFSVADANILPFRSSSFDTIICMFTVLNLCDCRKAVKEMKRVLKKNGIAVISVASVWDRKDYSFADKVYGRHASDTKNIRIEGNRMTFKLFTKQELVRLFENEGLINKKFTGVYRWQAPCWNKYRDFSRKEKAKLLLDFLFPSSHGRIYIAEFRKA